jgi:hypothetical protein
MNLIIGSSHTLYFSEAVGSVQATWQEASQDLIRVESVSGADNRLLFTTNRPSFISWSRTPAGEPAHTFGPLMEKIRAFNQAGSKVVFAIGGNEHNMRFLCANPRPFDFHHMSCSTMDPARQILPSRGMREILEGLLERTLAVTRVIAGELPLAERYYLAPPPPIPSEDHLRRQSEVFDFKTHGVEAAAVRLKIYNLYVEIIGDFCAETGIGFIPPVPENRDEAGFLREAYWSGATHASADYYRGIVSELGL